MYLSILSKEEKELFLGLAFALASADGVYSEEEKEMIDIYCHEMQIIFNQETMVKPVDDILSVMKWKCDIQIKKIVIFELLGLAMADGKYDESERRLVFKIERELDIEKGFATKCEVVLNEYMSFQERISQLILG